MLDSVIIWKIPSTEASERASKRVLLFANVIPRA